MEETTRLPVQGRGHKDTSTHPVCHGMSLGRVQATVGGALTFITLYVVQGGAVQS